MLVNQFEKPPLAADDLASLYLNLAPKRTGQEYSRRRQHCSYMALNSCNIKTF